MPSQADLAVRLAEILDIPEDQAIELTARLIPVFSVESIVGIPTTRVTGLAGAPGYGSGTQAAIAANNSHVQLLNPVDSGVELHVDRVLLWTGASSEVRLREHDTGLSAIAVPRWRDRRRGGRPVGDVRFGTNVGELGTLIGTLASADTNILRDLEIDAVLGEGQGLVIVATTVNVRLVGFWYWREVR